MNLPIDAIVDILEHTFEEQSVKIIFLKRSRKAFKIFIFLYGAPSTFKKILFLKNFTFLNQKIKYRNPVFKENDSVFQRSNSILKQQLRLQKLNSVFKTSNSV